MPDILAEIDALAAGVEPEQPRPLVNPEDVGLPPKSTWGTAGKMGIAETFATEGWERGIMERVPVMGAVQSTARLLAIKQAAERIKKAQEEGVDIAKDYAEQFSRTRDDLREVARYVYETEMEQTRGISLGAGVATILADMVPFMAEFVATGGLATPARKATEEATKRALGKGIAGKVVGDVAGRVTGAAIRTALSLGRIGESFARRQIPSMELTPEGVTAGEVESPGVSAIKAAGDVFVEMLSEESGDLLGKAIGTGGKATGKLANKVIGKSPVLAGAVKKIGAALRIEWMLTKGATAKEFYAKVAETTGFHGMLEEMGEERVGEILRGVMGIDPYNAPSWDQLKKEAVAFALPAGARHIAARARDFVSSQPPASVQELADKDKLSRTCLRSGNC